MTLCVVTLAIILLYSKQAIDTPAAPATAMPQEVRDAIAAGDFRTGMEQIAVYAKQKASIAEDKTPPSSKPAKASHGRQRIILSFKNDTPQNFDSSLQTLKDMKQVKVIELSTIGLVVVEVPSEWNLEWLSALLRVDETVKDIGYDYPVRINAVRANDPNFMTDQAYMNSINITEAWAYTTGSTDVIVAVIDTGIDYMYDELTPNLWVNHAEATGVAGQDDDNNGCVDDIYGCDYINNDGDPWDDHNHGTNVASLIGMQGNNGKLGAGVNWHTSIMSIKILDYTGVGSASRILQALHYVLAMRNRGHNVRVVNMSVGGALTVDASETPCAKQNLPVVYQMISDAVDSLASTGVLSVVAAGNEGRNIDLPGTSTFAYLPGCLDNDLLVSVASSNDPYAQQLSSFSNYGRQSVDLAAPGLAVYTVGPLNVGQPQQRKTTVTTSTIIFDDTINQTTAGWVISGMVPDNYPSDNYPHCQVSGGWERVSDDNQSSYWTESREGNYQSCVDLSLTREAIDLSQYDTDDYVVLTFLLKTALETGTLQECASTFCDALFLEIRTIGTSWSLINAWGGNTQQRRHSVTIPRWAYREGFQFRFRFVSDPYTVFDGVEISEIRIVRQPTGSNSDKYSSGTSFASPIVAGVAGLLWSFDPTLSVTQTRSAILSTVNARSQFSSKLTTGGFLNAGAALYSIADDGIHATLHPSVFEREGQGQLSVRLTRKPLSSTSVTDVVLDIATLSPQVSFSTPSLIFTQSNWHIPQTVNFSVVVGSASSAYLVLSVRDQDSATQYHAVTDTTLLLEIIAWQVSLSDREVADNTIAENASAGTPVRQLELQAIDGLNRIVSASTWSLPVNPGGLFAIQSTSGVVSLARGNALDYETTQSYSLVVSAVASRYNTVLAASLTVTVAVTNVFEQLTIIEVDGNATNNEISEGATTNTLVSKLRLQSQDEAMRLLSSVEWQLLRESSSIFRISTSSNSASIATTRLLDYETSTRHTVTVRATARQGGVTLTSDLTITIMVTNVLEQLTIVETDGDATNNDISEAVATGTTVSNLQLQAQDEAMRLLSSVEWQLLDESGSTASSAFKISTLSSLASTAGIATTRLLDYETSTRHTVIVRAIARQGGVTLTSDLTVTIAVMDVFEQLTVIEADSDAANNRVSEGVATGTTVSNLQLQAQDEAMRLLLSIEWRLLDESGSTASSTFKISTSSNSASTASITTARLLDYETSTSHTVIVEATAHQGGVTLTNDLTITIMITNVLEQLTIVETDGDATNNQVLEGMTTGTIVSNLQLQAQDEAIHLLPSVEWRLVRDLSNAFKISTSSNPASIATTRLLDYETSTRHTIIVEAIAHQGGVMLTRDLTVTIAVTNVFEQLTIVETDGDATNNWVSEAVATGTTVSNLQLQAQDEAIHLLPSVEWRLVRDLSNAFKISTSSSLASTASIATTRLLDYETSTSHTVIVEAIAHQGSVTRTSDLTITVMVTNVFEQLTIVETDSDATNNRVSEAVATGTTVSNLQLQAQDEAMYLLPSVEWRLVRDLSNAFKISTSSNPVSIATTRLLDYETNARHTVIVEATAHQGGVTRTSDLTVTIAVTNVFEQLAIVETDNDATNNQISEAVATGTTVSNLQLQAQDEAMRLLSSVEWRLVRESASAFKISTSSNPASIATTRLLDYETSTSHTVIVEAIAHQGGVTRTSDLTVTIAVTNVFEQLTIVEADSDATNNRVSEGVATGTTVSNLQLQAQDEAMHLLPSVEWRLVRESSNAFKISTSSHLVSAASIATTRLLDYETNARHAIIVEAIAHQGGVTRTSDLTITVMVTNVFEQLTIVETDSDATNNRVSEGVATGTTVSSLQLQAQDEAMHLLPSVEWRLVRESASAFKISTSSNPASIATTRLLDYETSTRHTVIVEAIAHQDGVTLMSDLTITITVASMFEQLTIVETDGDATNNEISEGAIIGATVSNLQLQVQDEAMRLLPSVEWRLVRDLSNAFKISTSSTASTASIATTRLLDYETSTRHTVIVQAIAHQGGVTLTSDLTVTIAVMNMFEQLTIVEADGDATNNRVSEGVVTGTTVSNLQLQVQDEAMRLLPSVEWQLVRESSNAFKVSTSSTASIATTRLLDYEMSTSHTVIVQAIARQGGVTLTSDLTITVIVMNMFEQLTIVETDGDATNNQISEEATTNTLVSNLQLQSHDEAMRLLSSVEWRLTSESSNAFKVSTSSTASTASIATTRLLDYEMSTSHTVIVQAIARQGGVTLTSDLTVTITVMNVFEQLTIVEADGDATNNQISEEATTNTLVSNLQLQSHDEAMRLLPSVEWQLVRDLSNAFKVSTSSHLVSAASTASIATTRLLDYETSTRHTVIVQAIAHRGGVTLTSDLTVTIIVTDVEENIHLRLRLFLEGVLQ